MNRQDLTEFHYIIPCENVASVLTNGILSHERVRRLRHASVADNVVQQKRDGIRVPGGLKLHQYVNLYFNARNAMMYTLSNHSSTPLCVLSVDVNVIDLPNVVIYDGNAASDWSRAYESPQGLASVDKSEVFATSWNDPTPHLKAHKRRVVQAEVLVPNSVDASKVQRAYAPDNRSMELLAINCPSLDTEKKPALFFK